MNQLAGLLLSYRLIKLVSKMQLARTTFLELLRKIVIHSEPVGELEGLNCFAVLRSLHELEDDHIDTFATAGSPYYWSNRWAATGNTVDRLEVRFPILAVLPISENMEGLGSRSVMRRTTYGLYFLAQYENQEAGERRHTTFDLQEAMSVQARRVFHLLAQTVYASVDGEAYEYNFIPVLDDMISKGIIGAYETDERHSKAIRKALLSEESAPGGYVDNLGKNSLYGVTFNYGLLECIPDDSSLTYNNLCC